MKKKSSLQRLFEYTIREIQILTSEEKSYSGIQTVEHLSP